MHVGVRKSSLHEGWGHLRLWVDCLEAKGEPAPWPLSVSSNSNSNPNDLCKLSKSVLSSRLQTGQLRMCNIYCCLCPQFLGCFKQLRKKQRIPSKSEAKVLSLKAVNKQLKFPWLHSKAVWSLYLVIFLSIYSWQCVNIFSYFRQEKNRMDFCLTL